MENRLFSNPAYAALIYHSGRQLFLFTEDKERLFATSTSIFHRVKEKTVEIAAAAFSQHSIPESECNSRIRSVSWLLQQGYLPLIKENQLNFRLAQHQAQNNDLVQQLKNEITQLSDAIGFAVLDADVNYTCPITSEVFREPYLNEFGHTYERVKIQEIFEKKEELRKCPISQQIMTRPPFPNFRLRQIMDNFRSPPIPLLPAMENREAGDELDKANKLRLDAEENIREKRFAAGIELLRCAFEAGENYEHYLFLANIYQQMNDLNKAALVYLRLSQLQIQRDEFPQGFENIERAFELIGDQEDGRQLLRSLIFKRRGDPHRACETLRQLARRSSEIKNALNYWEQALICNPKAEGLLEEIVQVISTKNQMETDKMRVQQVIGMIKVVAALHSNNLDQARLFREKATELAPISVFPRWATIISNEENPTPLFRILSKLSPDICYYFEKAAESGELEDVWSHIEFLNQRTTRDEAFKIYVHWLDVWLSSERLNLNLAKELVNRARLLFSEDPQILEHLHRVCLSSPELNFRDLRDVTEKLGKYYEEVGDWEKAERVYQIADAQIHDNETPLKLGRVIGKRSPSDAISLLSSMLPFLLIEEEYELGSRYIALIRDIVRSEAPRRLEHFLEPRIFENLVVQMSTIELFNQLRQVQRNLDEFQQRMETIKETSVSQTKLKINSKQSTEQVKRPTIFDTSSSDSDDDRSLSREEKVVVNGRGVGRAHLRTIPKQTASRKKLTSSSSSSDSDDDRAPRGGRVIGRGRGSVGRANLRAIPKQIANRKKLTSSSSSSDSDDDRTTKGGRVIGRGRR